MMGMKKIRRLHVAEFELHAPSPHGLHAGFMPYIDPPPDPGVLVGPGVSVRVGVLDGPEGTGVELGAGVFVRVGVIVGVLVGVLVAGASRGAASRPPPD